MGVGLPSSPIWVSVLYTIVKFWTWKLLPAKITLTRLCENIFWNLYLARNPLKQDSNMPKLFSYSIVLGFCQICCRVSNRVLQKGWNILNYRGARSYGILHLYASIRGNCTRGTISKWRNRASIQDIFHLRLKFEVPSRKSKFNIIINHKQLFNNLCMSFTSCTLME